MGVLERARLGGLAAMQLIMLLAAISLYTAIAVLDIPVDEPVWLAVAAALLLVATTVGLVSGGAHKHPAGALVALGIDILAIIALRTALLESAPSVSLLAVLPIVWLAGGYARWGGVAGTAAALLIAVLPRTLRGAWDISSTEALQATLPIAALIILAAATNAGARVFHRRSEELAHTTAEAERAHAIAAERDALARSIVDSLDLGIAVYAPAGTLQTANAAARRFADAEGLDLDDPAVRRPDAPPTFAADRRTRVPHEQSALLAASTGRELAPQTVWIGEPDRQQALSTSSHAVVRSDGVVVATMLLTRDVTEAERTRHMRHDFLAAVSHELRTPLTPLIGHLELLAEEAADDPRVRGRLDVLWRNATRLSERMDEIAVAGDASSELERTSVDLGALVAVAVARRASAAEARLLTVIVDAPASVLISADGPRLTRAIDALVGNALKFAPAGSVVTVRLRGEADEATITVEDEGPGIPDDEELLLFEPFMRGRYAHENAVAGFGLGLSQAHAVVTAHGGRLRVHSPHPTGTTASLTLPRS